MATAQYIATINWFQISSFVLHCDQMHRAIAYGYQSSKNIINYLLVMSFLPLWPNNIYACVGVCMCVPVPVPDERLVCHFANPWILYLDTVPCSLGWKTWAMLQYAYLVRLFINNRKCHVDFFIIFLFGNINKIIHLNHRYWNECSGL